MNKILLNLLFLAFLGGVFVLGFLFPRVISADIYDTCSNCGNIFCSAPCNSYSNTCGCEAILCDWYDYNTCPPCTNDVIYGCQPCTKQICGGTGICIGDCPSWINPCYNDCGSEPTPPPPPPCNCGVWSNISCGAGGCLASEIQQTRTCSPAGCLPESRCTPDASCGCTCDSTWIDVGCGLDGCAPTQMQQTRTCSPAGCSSESRCIDSAACGAYSCSISLSDVNLVGIGSTQAAIVTVNSETPPGAYIDYVTFASGNPGVASVISPDLDPAFQTNITAQSLGSTTYTVNATMNDGITTCSAVANVNVTNPGAWCQFKEGDAITPGNINCPIPPACTLPTCDPVLITSDTGDYPGVPHYGGTINPAPPNISSTNWNAGAAFSAPTVNFASFERKIQGIPYATVISPVTNLSQLLVGLYQGYYWVFYDGNAFGNAPLQINSDIDLGDNRVVLFVADANLEINGRINLNDGRGIFMAVVERNIQVTPTVGGPADGIPELEGLYFTDGIFATGTAGVTLDSQLHLRGSVVALTDVNLQRDLANNSLAPSELFEFGPDQQFLFPPPLSVRNIQWREVAP